MLKYLKMKKGKIEELPLELVVPDPNQPRTHFEEEKIKELAHSIQQHGLLQPILVRPIDGGKFQIVHGERRFRACTYLGHETIRAEVRKLEDDKVLEIQIVENAQREDLNPIEEAKALRRMVKKLGYTHKKIAERTSKSREYVTNRIRLLKLPNDIQRGVARGNLSEGHARALLPLDDFEKQRIICREISRKKLNVRETERIVKSLKERNVSHETSGKAIVEVKDLAVTHLIEGKERVDLAKLESALISDLKTTRRLRHG